MHKAFLHILGQMEAVQCLYKLTVLLILCCCCQTDSHHCSRAQVRSTAANQQPSIICSAVSVQLMQQESQATYLNQISRSLCCACGVTGKHRCLTCGTHLNTLLQHLSPKTLGDIFKRGHQFEKFEPVTVWERSKAACSQTDPIASAVPATSCCCCYHPSL